MRCFAIAQAATEKSKKVAVVLQQEESGLAWPCPVLLSKTRALESAVAIVDGFENQGAWPAEEIWFIVDRTPTLPDHGHGYIWPHFGAQPIENRPTLVGPRWMPLRKVFRQIHQSKAKAETWGGYRVPQERREGIVAFPEGTDPWPWLETTTGLVCPPSTIAYEAMSQGRPVLIHDGHSYPEIARAMFAAGVAASLDIAPLPASHRDILAESGRRAVDGMGAQRIVEALL